MGGTTTKPIAAEYLKTTLNCKNSANWYRSANIAAPGFRNSLQRNLSTKLPRYGTLKRRPLWTLGYSNFLKIKSRRLADTVATLQRSLRKWRSRFALKRRTLIKWSRDSLALSTESAKTSFCSSRSSKSITI